MSKLDLCGLGQIEICDASADDLEGSAECFAECADAVIDSVVDAAQSPRGQQWATPEMIGRQLTAARMLNDLAIGFFRKAIETARAEGGAE